uniref:BHLH domain-containing protein n=1 Tax=Elaeophora elaphi TaxID=1147741 RepID=A0A0R3RPK9_9BILA
MSSIQSVNQTTRLNVNLRERCRMHDLNEAFDDLRVILPYANGTSASAIEEMRRIIHHLQQQLLNISFSPCDTKP